MRLQALLPANNSFYIYNHLACLTDLYLMAWHKLISLITPILVPKGEQWNFTGKGNFWMAKDTASFFTGSLDYIAVPK